MKGLFISLFAFICVAVCSLAQVHAAATTFGVRLDFTDAAGKNVGLAMLTFDAVGFNEWMDFSELENLTVSGAITDVAQGWMHNFGHGSISGGLNGQFLISDASPWYPVTFSSGAGWIHWYFATVDLSSGSQCDVNLESGEWAYENGQGMTSAGIFTPSVWFDDPVPSEVPIPASAFLLISGLLPAAALRKRFFRS